MHIEPLTYYDLLEVSETATASQVRKAYLKKAAECHPDKHVGTSEEDRATEAFKAINEAYETLFDADLREEYDQKLATLRLANRSPSPEPRPVPTYVSPPFFPFPPMQPMRPVGLHPPPLHPHPGAGAGAGAGAGRGGIRFPAPLFHPFFTPPTDPAFRPFLRRERVFRPRPMPKGDMHPFTPGSSQAWYSAPNPHTRVYTEIHTSPHTNIQAAAQLHAQIHAQAGEIYRRHREVIAHARAQMDDMDRALGVPPFW